MRIDVVTLFPEMIRDLSGYGIQGRAIAQGVLELGTWNPRDFTTDRHRNVDDRPYGGGPGMVMQVQPLRDAICAARSADSGAARVICL
ncbi:MAG: tRNA (guanosine(37)-N1)-methyltransferase TrmD, partial [Gammaproteobacteria bacterium]